MFTLRARLFTGLLIITCSGFFYLAYWVLTDIRVPGLRGTEESLVESAVFLADFIGKKVVQQDTVVYNDLHAAFDSVYNREIGVQLYGQGQRKQVQALASIL